MRSPPCGRKLFWNGKIAKYQFRCIFKLIACGQFRGGQLQSPAATGHRHVTGERNGYTIRGCLNGEVPKDRCQGLRHG